MAADMLVADYDRHHRNSISGEKLLRIHRRRTSTSSGVVPHRTVFLAPGMYTLTEPLRLDARHSHTTWIATSNDVGVRGGYRFDPKSFQRYHSASSAQADCPCDDYHQCDLQIWVAPIPTNIDLGTLQSGGLGDCAHSGTPDIYWNDIPLSLARHPNAYKNGTWQWFHVHNVTESSASNTFWRSQNDTVDLSNATDIWVHGFWNWDWADNYVRVADVQGHRKVIIDNVTTPVVYNQIRQNARYRWINALELLDAPGEYYIDRQQRLLYLIPPITSLGNRTLNETTGYLPADVDIRISTVENLISGVNLSDTTFRNIDFSISRGITMKFINTTRVQIRGGSIFAVGGDWAVYANNSLQLSVQQVELNDLACGGVMIKDSGNPRTLQSSESEIHECCIHDFAQWKRSYVPALRFVASVGLHASYNHISNAPHIGMAISGNNCLLEHNTLSDLCTDTVDAGSFYAGRSWAERNNTLRHNAFYRIKSSIQASTFVQAIYLDDEMSGWTIENTTIVDSDVGILLGGGRRNHIINTTLIRVDNPIYIDKRGVGSKSCTPTGLLMDGLRAVHYQEPPWSTVHPEIVHIQEDRPCKPVYNTIRNFTFCHEDAHRDNWFLSGDTSVAELLLWDNIFDSIQHNPSLCNSSTTA
jgi:hypothetical protein